MLERIRADGGDVTKYVRQAKDPNDPFRLSASGTAPTELRPRHGCSARRPSASWAPAAATGFWIARQLEEVALNDEFFIERMLYPNVDFYSGLIYRAMGFPTDMFPVLFAIGRLPGWIAHWHEMMLDKKTKIGRPRQIYIGPTEHKYVPVDQRG